MNILPLLIKERGPDTPSQLLIIRVRHETCQARGVLGTVTLCRQCHLLNGEGLGTGCVLSEELKLWSSW